MYVRAGRCLCGASAPSIAARVRRMNTFFISILTATSQPHTVDLRTRSQYHMSYSHNTGMRTRRPQIGVRLAPHAAHAATAGPHAHSAHPGDRQQRRQDLQSAVALADENKLCGLITAAHSTMMLQPPHAGAGRRCRPCATRTRCARLAASSGDRCRARKSSDGCASPRLRSRRAATVASGIACRRRTRISCSARVGAVEEMY